MGDSLEDQLKEKLDIFKQENIKLEQDNAELKKKVNRLEEEVKAYSAKETNLEAKFEPKDEVTVSNKEVAYGLGKAMAYTVTYPFRLLALSVLGYEFATFGPLLFCIFVEEAEKNTLKKDKPDKSDSVNRLDYYGGRFLDYFIPEFSKADEEPKGSFMAGCAGWLGFTAGVAIDCYAAVFSYS